MRCCVPFCRNTLENVTTSEKDKGITFHGFPCEKYLRATWLRVLGKQDTHLADSAVICSQHFLSDEIYETESGIRQIGTGAIPSTVQVCFICLDTGSKLFLMSKHKLEKIYEKLTGLPLCDRGNLKQTICVQCAQKLINFSQFREKSLRARSLMVELVEKHELITMKHIKMLKSAKYQLGNNLVSTMLGHDHYDLHIVENPDENEQIATVAILKKECNDAMSVDDDKMKEKSEYDNYAVNVIEEYSISNNSVQLGVKPLDDGLCKALKTEPAASTSAVCPLKYEQATLECTNFEELPDEHEYNEQKVDCDGETSQVWEPHTAASYSCDSSHVTKHKHAVLKPNDDSRPSTDLAQTLVAPLSARLTTNNEIEVVPSTEEADTIKKSNRVLEINDGESDNQSSDSNNQSKTDNKRFTNCVVMLYDVFSERKASSSSASRNFTAFKVSHSPATSKNEVPASENTSLHIRTNTKKIHSCKLCDYKCSQNNHLAEHMRTHTGERPFTCKFCAQKFTNNSHLRLHIRIHTGEKPFLCNLCEFKCARSGSLLVHMRTHTGEKPFSCNLCDYKCIQKSHLVAHIRTHTGEKPYSCKLCEYKCAGSKSLLAHMRKHHDHKTYSCNLCKFKFARNADLVLHMKTHNGEKPFSCTLCDFKFVKKHNLQKHMKTH